MPLLKRLCKPEYFFRPSQLLLRLYRIRRPEEDRLVSFKTPWGLQLEANVNEHIGMSLWHLGVYDLVVSEAIWRLTETGETLIDVGANIGYMTSLMARRAQRQGKVVSFEPHPKLFRQLQRNIEAWNFAHVARVTAICAAVSASAGQGRLCIPGDFRRNAGLAYLQTPAEVQETHSDAAHIDVQVVALDDYLGEKVNVGLMKVDTEGNENSVFEGSRRLIEMRRVRDIIFEDHGQYPTPPMVFLEKAGYVLHRLRKAFFGPRLVSPTQPLEPSPWEPVSYVATVEPDRLIQQMRGGGWRVLEAGSRD
jgi:FkbM family methyltransferase